MDNTSLCAWKRGDLGGKGCYLGEPKQELSHPGGRKAHAHYLGINSPVVSHVPGSYMTRAEKHRSWALARTSHQVLGPSCWAAHTEGIVWPPMWFRNPYVASLNFIRGAMSPFWRVRPSLDSSSGQTPAAVGGHVHVLQPLTSHTIPLASGTCRVLPLQFYSVN